MGEIKSEAISSKSEEEAPNKEAEIEINKSAIRHHTKNNKP